MRQGYRLLLFALMLLAPMAAQAQLVLPRLFTSGAVLQREQPLPVWGTAAAGAEVTVTLNGVSETATAAAGGAWRIDLPPMGAGGPFVMTVASGTQTVTLTDVYLGDVWLASGQSNIEWTVSQTPGAAAVIAAANDPRIRQFKVPKALAPEPAAALPSGSAWTPATSAYVGNFTAVGYFFARDLRAHLNVPVDVPIGLLNVTYGGSRIETWMSEDLLGFDEQDRRLANGEPERQATVAYNAMIHPLLPFAIKGVVWYQGESNADTMEDALAYGGLFKTLIQGWRDGWGGEDMPFVWVQLPNFGTPPGAQPSTWDAWPRLRAGQDAALSLPNTGQVVTIDVGGEDIHPPDKLPVGRRLALVVRDVAYGHDVVASGPRYRGNTLEEDGRVRLRFDYAEGGLVGGEEGSVDGFAVAGADGRFVWADAAIEGDEVVVWSAAVPEPVTVRYAWEYNPVDANLYNAAGLPAAPFGAEVDPGFKIAAFTAGRGVIEQGQSTTLSWRVYGASSVTLNGAGVDSVGTRLVAPEETTVYTLRAVDRENPTEADSATVIIEVLDPDVINRALGRPATASTFEACCGALLTPDLAVDGDPETRWSSAWSDGALGADVDPNLDDDPDDEWIMIDLGAPVDLERVILTWEAAYGSAYAVELSYDGYRWTSVYTEDAGDGGVDDIAFDTPPAGRYLRLHGQERGTPYGYSLYEIAAYGTLSAKQPPTVTPGTAAGNVTAPGTAVTLVATATDADGTVAEVAFFVDGAPVGTDDAAPFQATWTPAAAGTYRVTVVVTDDDKLSVQSAPFPVYVVDLIAMTRYEAELAVATGQANRLTAASASGGAYMELRDAWTITWPAVSAPAAGRYLLGIGYQLTFDSPKAQYLVVNGDTVETVMFTAPNTGAWLQHGVEVQLRAGPNEIALHGFWNWMSFDYIAVGLEALAVGVEEEGPVLPSAFALAQNYPNPFNPATVVAYTLARPAHVRLEVFDVTGRRVGVLADGLRPAGAHTARFDAAGLASGVYLYRLQVGGTVQTRRMVLVR